MADHKEGSFKVVVPPGATLKAGVKVTAGQASGPVPDPNGGEIFIHEDITNDSKEGDIILDYSYSWPGGDHGHPDSTDSPE